MRRQLLTIIAAAAPSTDAPGGAAGALAAPTPEEVSHAETFVLPYSSVLPGELWLQPLFPRAAAAAAPLRALLQTTPRAGHGGDEERTALDAALPALQEALSRSPHAAPRSGRDEPAGGTADDVAGSAWRASWCTDYAIAACAPGTGRDGLRDAAGTAGSVRVALWHAADAPPTSKMRAVWHAALLRAQLSEATRLDAPTIGDVLDAAGETAHATWPTVHAALERAGWDLSNAHLDGDAGCLDARNDSHGERGVTTVE